MLYATYSYRLELFSPAHRFQISIPHNFLLNKVTALPYVHQHAKYEVIYIHPMAGETDRFLVIPPLVRHSTFQESQERTFATTFQFAPEELEPGAEPKPCYAVLERFGKLLQPLELWDTFGGGRRMNAIRRALQEQRPGYYDKLNAEFLLLMVDLALQLPPVEPAEEPPKRSLDEMRLDIIDSFFVDNYFRPDCRREELANLLCISERQLSRVLEEHYRLSFSELLLRTRMEIAEGWRRQSHLRAERLAELVGYQSAPAFLAAYKHYFGRSFHRAEGDKPEIPIP